MTTDATGAYVAPPCADHCRRVLVDIMGKLGVEVHATWAAPLFPSQWEPLNMDCPHGVHWFMEPTAEGFRALASADSAATGGAA